MTQNRDAVEVQLTVVEAEAKTLFDRIFDHLTARDFEFYADAEKQYLSFSLRLRDGNARILVEAAEVPGWSRILVYTSYPTFVPENRRLAIAEALTRINYSSLFGNFEMDLTDGEVRVRTVLEDEGFIGEAMIDRAIRRGLALADQYQAALLSIAFGNSKAMDVLEMAAINDGATLQ